MENWIVDEGHSTVGFEVKHMMVSKVRGQFDSFTAQIEGKDLSDLTTAKVRFTFDVASINTRNKERDKHLKSADFFDLVNYPMIHFTSTNIIKQKNNTDYQLTGDLTIKDKTNPVTFHVTSGGKATDPSGSVVYGYEAEAVIDREEFGLTWNTLLETGGVLVGEEVKMIVQLELKEENDVSSSSISTLNKPSHQSSLKQEVTSQELYKIIAENLTDLVTLIDRNGVIQYVSPSFKTMFHYELPSLPKSNFYELIHPDEQGAVKSEILSYVGRTIKKELRSEFRLLHANGPYHHVEATIVEINENSSLENELILVIMRDVGERKEIEKTVYQLAFHDALTSLPNRRSFMNQLRSEVMERNYSNSKLSILFIDLDDFKIINDRWGHDVGDLALKEVAKRIQSAIRPTDVAARIGGDEFVVMLKDAQEEEVPDIAQRMLNQLQNPINEAGIEHTLSCSIGVAHYPVHGDSPEDLIKNADTALYYVKERGKNNFKIFDRLIEHQSLERRILESALRQGIKEKQFFLEYQPKMNMMTNELIGMEALVRWKHPELGIIPPNKFIPLAEETGLIVPLGEWILRESCRQTVEWQEMNYPSLTISVNVSVRQFEEIHFVDKVKRILQETGLDPKWLELEITESVLANVESTIAILNKLRELGIRISVDDFGTGYSSLSYIKELPIDILKIDQSFVKDIHTNKESKEIAKAIINLANSIGLNVIAEGVELKEHVNELKKDGGVLAQGYFYSRPLKVEAFEEYMSKKHEVS